MAPPPKQVLTLVRIALLTGVLVFGAVAYVVRQGSAPSIAAGEATTLRLVGMIVWGIALAGLIGLRLVFRARAEAGRDTKLPLIAWALGEMPALFGGVFYLLTGDWTIFMTGLVGLLAAFALFPVPQRG